MEKSENSGVVSQTRWRTVIILAFSQVVDGLEGGVIKLLFPIIRDSFQLSLTNLGVFSSIPLFSRMLLGTFWGVLADRYGRKNILVIVTGLWGIWTVAAGFAQNYRQLVILFAVSAIGTVASAPITSALLTDLYSPGERGKAFGALRFYSGIGIAILTPLLGQFSKIPETGWRFGLFTMGGVSILSGFLILFFVKEPKRGSTEMVTLVVSQDTGNIRDILDLLRIPSFRVLSISMAMLSSVLIFNFAATYLVDMRGFTILQASNIFGIFMVGFIISSLIGGYIGDYAERVNPHRGRIILFQINSLIFAFISYLTFQVEYSSAYAYFLIAFILGLIISIGVSGAVLPIISMIALPRARSTAYGFLIQFVQGTVGAILSIVFGKLGDQYGLDKAMLWVITVPYLVNVVLWFAMYKTYPDDLVKMQDKLSGDQEHK